MGQIARCVRLKSKEKIKFGLSHKEILWQGRKSISIMDGRRANSQAASVFAESALGSKRDIASLRFAGEVGDRSKKKKKRKKKGRGSPHIQKILSSSGAKGSF